MFWMQRGIERRGITGIWWSDIFLICLLDSYAYVRNMSSRTITDGTIRYNVGYQKIWTGGATPLLTGCGRYSVDKIVFILYNARRLKMGSRNAARFVC